VSLINEALQRAREEAVRQEAAKKGVPLAPAARPKEKSGWLSLAVLVLAVALAVSVIALLGFAWRLPSATTESALLEPSDSGSNDALGSGVQPGIEASSPAIETGAATTAQTADVSGKSTSSPKAATDTAPTLSPTNSVTRSDVATTENGSARPREFSGEDSTALGAPEPTSYQVDTDPITESYIRYVDLGGNVSIELGGIAWSESGPFALLNGRVVGIGESISGFMVREIDPQQVVLERQNRQLVLRLK
jgi:cytoskeletal protein RodZ